VLSLLDPRNPHAPFPSADLAEREPNGLLAVGGDLHPDRLLNAYRHGIFPWYSDDQPILWWSPDPRMVLYPERLSVSRSLRKALRNRGFLVSVDRAFPEVIQACAGPRAYAEGTWITQGIYVGYNRLHQMGHAHSVEVWREGALVGGLYGVAVGRVFCGESMFSLERDASKAALVHLVRVVTARGFDLVDCQVYTDHLASLGAEEIPRRAFIHHLRRGLEATDGLRPPHLWTADPAPPEVGG